ncbi:hypothetical protein BDC45DRAFT_501241 [Circinella umbellata]|nr:hypothetical protein BDC45DRAFT_501241 [Circinella umbellata]
MTRDAILGKSSPLAEWEPKSLSRTTTATQLTPSCLKRIFSNLSRSDLVRVALTCRAWSTPALERIWSSFKFVREREFERVFAIITRRSASHRYGLFVKTLELVHADRDFYVNPNIILLVTSACPNLESISITFHNTRPVAPPVAMQHRPVLPPIKRSGDITPNHQPPQQQQNRQHHHLPHNISHQQHPLQQQLHNNNVPRPNHSPPIQQQQQIVNNNNNNNNNSSSNNHSSSHSHHRQHNHSLPLAHFAHNCRKLRHIRLTSYSPKTDDSVYEMAKYLKSGTLESIVFTGCTTLQSSTLCKLALTNPQIRHIEIMGNTPVSDSSLATIAEHCGARLESISIGNAHHLTDLSIRHVAKRCKNLKQLILFSNPDGNKLHEETLIEVLRQCTQLRVMNLSNARVLSNQFFEFAAARVERELKAIGQSGNDTNNNNNINNNNNSKYHHNHQQQEHKHHGSSPSLSSGLQRLCLGGVRREVIHGPGMAHLIRLSASKNDTDDDDEDEDDDDDDKGHDRLLPTSDNNLSHIMGSAAHMPKSTVIRGSSIWWQRRRPALDPHSTLT